MIARVVVMLVPAAPGRLSVVPDIREGCHRLGLALVEHPQEIGVNRPAVAVDAAAVEAQGIGQEFFMACHDVGQVPKGLRRVALGSDVDVYATTSCCVALGSRPSKDSYELL